MNRPTDMNSKMVASKEFYVLGTNNLLKACGEKAEHAIYESMKKLLEIDNRMSIFKEDSEISQINKNAGISFVNVSDDTYEVIEEAKRYSELSFGAIDITVKPVMDLWRAGAKELQIPEKNQIIEKLNLVSYIDISLDRENKAVKLEEKDQCIDAGAIAKGFAADKVKEILKENNIESGIIDLGGNIVVIGNKPEGDPWKVGIQNPLGARGEYLGILAVSDKSVVTSGNYERYFIKDDKKFHHIIDPRTGYPSENGIISVTIVSDKSIDGDAITTCVYVMGVRDGLRFIKDIEGVDVIIVTEDRKVIVSEGIKNSFKLTNSAFEIVLEEGSCSEENI